jgi:hypothetical protein
MKRTSRLICIVTLSISAAACDRTRNDAATADPIGTTGPAVGDSGMVRVADLVDAPNSYVGKTVTVEADVEEVFGPRAFALDEDAPLAGGIDNNLLVFSKAAGDLADIDDEWLNNTVRVTGKVGRMSVVEIERELGWDLDPQLETELEGAGPVLIASSVDRIGQGTASAGPAAQAGEQARSELPGTASPLPLAALLSVVSLGTGIGLRRFRRRSHAKR